VTSVFGTERDTDRGADRKLQAVDEDWRRQFAQNAPRRGSHAFATRWRFHQYAEFIAAEARREAIVTDAALQARRDHLQQLVANCVTVHVIDRLEAIKVDEHQREGDLFRPD